MNFDILLLGLIILIGFVGNILFKYTKVPESLFMILIGLAVGPVFKIVDQTLFMTYMPIVSTLTLIIILLDSGFSLSIQRTIRTLSKASRLTILNLIFSTFFIGVFMYLMGWDLLHALFIGLACSETTTVVVASLLPRLSVPEAVRETLILDSILSDLTVVTASVIFLQIIQLQSIDLGQIVMAFVGPVTVAILFGILFMIVWVGVLWRFYRGEELIYVFTLGVLFILHSSVEAVGGNAAIAILVFSLSLGNISTIINTIQEELINRRKILSEFQIETFEFLRERFNDITHQIKDTEINFSFFIENFFFVYLGIIFDFEKINLRLVGVCLAILLLIYVSRYMSVSIVALSEPTFKQYFTIMMACVSRGFMTIFAALLPSTKGVEIPQLKETALIIVLLSTFTTILGSIVYERRLKSQSK